MAGSHKIQHILSNVRAADDQLRTLRGQFEERYGRDILNHDVIESIVHEFRLSASWLKNAELMDIEHEARVLVTTLKRSSAYNKSAADYYRKHGTRGEF